GLYTAPYTIVNGSDTVRAGDRAMSGTAAVTVIGLPAAPTNLVATGISTTQINLSWTDNASSATAYEVMRSTNGTSGWSVLVSNLPATAISYSDASSLTAGATYYYQVLALNHTTTSGPSNVASAATWPAAPSQPGGLSGAGTCNTADPTHGAINETGYS